MQNTVRDEAQAGIRIARRNINNLRYADGITPMAGSKEELKSLSKTKIMASGLIASWQIDGETMETVRDPGWGGLSAASCLVGGDRLWPSKIRM